MNRRAVNGLLALATCLCLPGPLEARDLTGLKGLGGSGGSSMMIGDWMFREHARPRLSGDALFKYGLKPSWVLVAGFGFHWNAYINEESWLLDVELLEELGFRPEPIEKVSTIAPFTVGVEYRFGTGDRVPYVGAGGGVYMKQILFNRSVGMDPRNNARHRTFDLGLYGRVGYEQFLSDAVSLDYDALLHIVFSQDRDRFPDPSSADLNLLGRDFKTYGGDLQNIQVRMGVRYYWGDDGL